MTTTIAINDDDDSELGLMLLVEAGARSDGRLGC
jgi:hypothetical protein